MHQSRIEFFAGEARVDADVASVRLPPGQIAGEDYLILPAKAQIKPRAYALSRPDPDQAHRRRIIAVTTRLLDLSAALGLLVLLLPVLVLLAAIVAVASGDAPIFAHRRIGKEGRPFNCYKFRSMCRNAEARLDGLLASNPEMRREWEAHHKLKDDPRVTPIGRFLRETSLDELPQLLNVLRGDMALVGPRPIVEAELPRYSRHLSSYLSVRPGLTGLWQVKCRSESSYRRRVAIDRVYAARKCLLLDLRILFATVPAVLSRRGAC